MKYLLLFVSLISMHLYGWNIGELSTGAIQSTANYDDGFYHLGKSRVFSRDEKSGIVTDLATDLQWQDNSEVSTNEQSFENANNYCENLSLGNHSDWRLPTFMELYSIIDHSKCCPVYFDLFTNIPLSKFWSSAKNGETQYTVDFNGGYSGSSFKGTENIRCVRGESSAKIFTRDNQNSIVTEELSGLVFLDIALESRSWSSALAYCESLEHANHNDWRLPNINELSLLINPNSSPALESSFQNLPTSSFWVSTVLPQESGTTSAWTINFYTGWNGTNTIDKSHALTCIRGGVGTISSSSSPASSSTSSLSDTLTLQIKNGWNLLALPIDTMLTTSTMSKLGNYDYLYLYREGSWIKNPSQIDAGEGFWLVSSSNYEISFNGDAYFLDFDTLSAGWSLLGSGEKLYNISESANILASFTYKNAQWIQDPESIEVGEGFWVYVDNREDIETIALTPLNPKVEFTQKTDAISLTISQDEAIRNSDGSLSIKRNYSLASQDSEKILFINGILFGRVSHVEDAGSGYSRYLFEKVEDISEAYESFSLSFEGLDLATAKSITRKNVGKFDILNRENIKLSPSKRSHNQQGILIEIPSGYILPMNLLRRSSSVGANKYSIYVIKSFDIFEIKVGGNIEYNFNTITDFDYGKNDIGYYLTFDYDHNESTKLNLEFETTTKIENKIEKTITLADPIEFKITIPALSVVESASEWVLGLAGYSGDVSIANIKLKITPELTSEFGGDITGKIVFKSTTGYDYRVKIDYDSQKSYFPIPTLNMNTKTPTFDLDMTLEANGFVNMLPYFNIYPELNMLGILSSVKIFYLKSGYKTANTIKGVIGAAGSSSDANSSLVGSLFGVNIFDLYAQSDISGQFFIEGGYDVEGVPFVDEMKDSIQFELFPAQKLLFMDFGILSAPSIIDSGDNVNVYATNLSSYYFGKVVVDAYFNDVTSQTKSYKYLDAKGVAIQKTDAYFDEDLITLNAKVTLPEDMLSEDAAKNSNNYLLAPKSIILDSFYTTYKVATSSSSSSSSTQSAIQWMSDEGVTLPRAEAVQYCKEKGGRLPEGDELKAAGTDGFVNDYYWGGFYTMVNPVTHLKEYYFYSISLGKGAYTDKEYKEYGVRCVQE